MMFVTSTGNAKRRICFQIVPSVKFTGRRSLGIRHPHRGSSQSHLKIVVRKRAHRPYLARSVDQDDRRQRHAVEGIVFSPSCRWPCLQTSRDPGDKRSSEIVRADDVARQARGAGQRHRMLAAADRARPHRRRIVEGKQSARGVYGISKTSGMWHAAEASRIATGPPSVCMTSSNLRNEPPGIEGDGLAGLKVHTRPVAASTRRMIACNKSRS
jgi:hypothetical protein